ncbi:uncharacterized protein LOC141704338 [Apium graveolens]|uniref:uncharacterized protein LOC141704338 n=1 Tax=Apium graveolens TaxID=4045 RepID=UPI003D7A6DEE
MGKGKPVGFYKISIKVWKYLTENGVSWLMNLFNVIRRIAKMPSEWRLSVVVSICNNKGDVQSCRNYRGIKLICHIMKLWKQVIDYRLWIIVDISATQLCFMPGSLSRAVIWRCVEAREVLPSRSKTGYIWANFSEENEEEDVAFCIANDRVPQTDNFKYLSSIIKSNGDTLADVTHRIKADIVVWFRALSIDESRRT